MARAWRECPGREHDSAFTFEFEEMTAWLAQQMSKTATSKLMSINWRTVGTIIQRVVKARLDPSNTVLGNNSELGRSSSRAECLKTPVGGS